MIKTTKIKINEKEFEVKKLALGRYADFLEALEKLPKEAISEIWGLDKVKEDDAQTLIKVLSILRKSKDQVFQVLSIATNAPVEVLTDEAGIDDAARLIRAVFEVNDFKLVKNEIGALVKVWKEKTKPEAPESPKDPKTG